MSASIELIGIAEALAEGFVVGCWLAEEFGEGKEDVDEVGCEVTVGRQVDCAGKFEPGKGGSGVTEVDVELVGLGMGLSAPADVLVTI